MKGEENDSRPTVIHAHVLEEDADMLVKEVFDYGIVEPGVDKQGADEGFYNVRKNL